MFCQKIQALSRSSFTGEHLRNALTLLVLLAPFFTACWLVRLYAVDTPFFDDFTFTEDWVKYKNHTLAFGDLFTAHMEHRVAVPRLISMGLHMVFGHDLRWQNFTTLLLMLGTAWNLLVLWQRTSGASLRASWLPLLLMSSVFFCAIQWQALLWPIMFEVFVPIFSFTLALRLWMSALNHWWALIISALCAAAGTLSFGNGILAWVLLPIAMLIARKDLERRTRWLLLAVWVVCTGITLGLYLHNFRNAAPSQFAYGQGHDETVGHDLKFFLTHLGKALSFASTLLGCHLSRGLNLQNIPTSERVGGISLGLFTLSLVYLWRNRRDSSLIRSVTPWVLLGLSSIGTAVLITIGRLWVYSTNAQAVTGRYVSHPIPLTIALIALLFILGRRLQARYPSLRTWGTVAGGAFLFLICVEWIYGTRMMELWSQTRLQGKSLLMFAKVMPSADYLASVAGDGEYAVRMVKEMASVDSLRTPLLADLHLNQFKISKIPLEAKWASFEGLRRNTAGAFEAEGFSELPDRRPADLVIFTYHTKPTEYEMFAIGTLTSIPRYIKGATSRDYEFTAVLPLVTELTSRWDGHVSVISIPPQKSDIDAWALDVKKMTVYRIFDDRVIGNPKLSRLIYPNSDEQKKPSVIDDTK